MPNTTPPILKITDSEFNYLVNYVKTNYGIDLTKKRVLIEGRLSYTVKSKGYSSYDQYIKSMLSDPSKKELEVFLNKITTNHSYFARETEHFEFLTKVALPQFEKTNRNQIRIWSAGCSSGQEAYNIAMIIDQYFGTKKGLWNTKITATDISTDVLTKAKAGIYQQDNLKDMPPKLLSQYFKKIDNDKFQVIDKIKNEVTFSELNLMGNFSFAQPFDIIFCRNVMIYFDRATTTSLVEKFYKSTANNGYLFIGHSELIDKTKTKYNYVMPAIYKKQI